ncbi:MAG: DUF4959 domain-containing protein [Bacteroidales bacterium]
MKNNNILLLLFGFLLILSCKEDKEPQYFLKGELTDLVFTPTIGGGYFVYKQPESSEFLYLKAEYEVNPEVKLVQTASLYKDTLFIKGLAQVKDYEIKLNCVYRDGSESQPIYEVVKPLSSSIETILNTLSIQPGFSSMICKWENVTKEMINIIITFDVGGKEIKIIDKSLSEQGRLDVLDLESEEYEFYGSVRDDYGNESEKVYLGKITPYFDYALDKQGWAVLPDQELPAGKENAPLAKYEGRIEKFWDDIIDDDLLKNMNYFHTGPYGYPFSYFIDLGRTVKVSRFRVWQRHYSGNTYYKGENVKTFELWISSDKQNWTLARNATIEKPGSDAVANEEGKAGHLFNVDDENPKYTESFRYLEYRGITPFTNNGKAGCTSEITLYGLEESDFNF